MPTNTEGKAYYISRPQADYNTFAPYTTAAPYNYRRLLVQRNDKPFDYKASTKDDADFATGSNFAKHQYLTMHDARGSFNPRIDSDLLGLLLLCALGNIASSAYSGGDAAAKRHVLTPANPKVTQQLPILSIIEKILPTEDYRWESNVLDQLEISGEGTELIKLALQTISSGKVVTPSGFVESGAGAHVGADGALAFFYNTQVSISIADAGTLANAVNPGCQLKSWGLTINNNHNAEDGYMPGCNKFQDVNDTSSGIYRSRCLMGRQVITPKFTIEVEAGSAWMTALRTQKKLDWNITLTGAAIAGTTKFHKAIFHGFNVAYESIERNQSGNILTYDIVPKILLDDGGNSFEAEVINTTTNYNLA